MRPRTKHPVARATTPALQRISENQIKSNLIEIKLEPRLYQTMWTTTYILKEADKNA
jgi:hypothetical protein